MERQLTPELSCPQENRTESEDSGGASRHENVAANDEDNFNPFRIEVNQETAMVRDQSLAVWERKIEAAKVRLYLPDFFKKLDFYATF